MDTATERRLADFLSGSRSLPFRSSDYDLVYDATTSGPIDGAGVLVDNIGDRPNQVLIRRQVNSTANLIVRFYGAGSRVYVDSDTKVLGLVRVHGNDCYTVIRAGQVEAAHFNITQWSNATLAYIGHGTSSNGSDLVVAGDGSAILIADDCMLSTGVWLKTSDMHAIVDLTTNQIVNRMANRGDIRVGQHVWIGQDVLVTMGVQLGSGSILGAKSLIREDVGPMTLWVGSPARQVREGVTWLRSLSMNADELLLIKERLGLPSGTSMA